MDLHHMDTAAMNRHIKGLFQAFKAAPDVASERALENALNDFLCRVILEKPNDVNAVRITAAPDLSRPERGIPDQHTIFSGRYGLQNFLAAAQPQGNELVLVKHLPYTHSTTTLRGSGIDCHDACETVKFGSRIMRDDVPYLDVSLNNDWFGRNRATFFLDEIKGIELALVEDGAFTPLLGRHGKTVEPAPSEATHYLKFRAFHGYMPHDVNPSVQKLGDVWVPHWATKLFTVERSDASYLPPTAQRLLRIIANDGLFDSTVRGYAVRSPEHDPVLYDFRDAKVPPGLADGFGADVNTAAYLMQLNEGKKRTDVTHRGRNIVHVLSGTPVTR